MTNDILGLIYGAQEYCKSHEGILEEFPKELIPEHIKINRVIAQDACQQLGNWLSTLEQEGIDKLYSDSGEE